MSSTTKHQNNAPSSNSGSLGNRKKSHSNKSSYLSKWLDKTTRQIQESAANLDSYDSYVPPQMNWPISFSHLGASHEPFKHSLYDYLPDPTSTVPSVYYNSHIHPTYNPGHRCVHHPKAEPSRRPRLRRKNDNKVEEVSSAPMENESVLSHMSYLQQKNVDNQDFASLPPIVTSTGDTNSTSELNANDKEETGNTRRYSDPCVRGLPDVARPANGDIESGSEESSDISENEVGNKLLSCLLDQITSLKLINEKLNKELHETRAELETLRHQNAYIQSASNTNLGGAAPLNSNGLLNGQYPPGFLTDLVREIRDATRLREEAMYTRVRAMVLERIDNSLASTESKISERTIEDIKSSLRASEADSRRMMDRIVKLEDDVRALRANEFDSIENRITNGNNEDSESECVRLRKEVDTIRKAKQNSEERALKNRMKRSTSAPGKSNRY
ncbi:uncharacterized protein [Battus philenor]|uniref:uncharacterized protein isoform X2 n=1 Tax=Battus philenor TaxID=42288 RepID=UPI0035CEB849